MTGACVAVFGVEAAGGVTENSGINNNCYFKPYILQSLIQWYKNENHIVVNHLKLTDFYFVSFKISSMNTFYTKIYRSGVECQFEDDSGDIFVK